MAVDSIVPGATKSKEMCSPSDMGSSWNLLVAHLLTVTHMCVRREKYFYRVIWIVAAINSSQSSLLAWRGTLAVWLSVCIRTEDVCYGATFLSPGNIQWLYLPINNVPSKTPTAKFSLTLNKTRTYKLHTWTNSRMGFQVREAFFCAVQGW